MRPIFSKSTGPILAILSGLVELLLHTANDESEILFRCVNGRCHGNQFFLVLVHGRHWTQAASGAAGRANVGLCPASSLESDVYQHPGNFPT